MGDGQKQKVTANYAAVVTHTYTGSAASFNACVTAYTSCGQNQSCQVVAFITAIEEANGQKQPSVLLVPNPAAGSTTVHYRFGSGMVKHTLTVYDMTGRLITSLDAEESVGEWPIKLDGWAAGVYQIILKTDGKVVAHSRLSVTH